MLFMDVVIAFDFVVSNIVWIFLVLNIGLCVIIHPDAWIVYLCEMPHIKFVERSEIMPSIMPCV